VAGKVVIAVGVAALGVALAHILLPAAIAGGLVEAVKGTALEELKSKLDDALLPDGTDEVEAEYASDRKALKRLYGISDARLEKLRSDWKQLPAGATDTALLVEESKQLVDETMCGLYLAWDAAIGAPWFTDNLPRRFEALGRQLQDLRNSLNESAPDAPAVADALGEVAEELLSARARLEEDIRPPDVEELEAEIKAQRGRVKDLEKQVTDAEHEVSSIRQDMLKLNAPRLGKPPLAHSPASERPKRAPARANSEAPQTQSAELKEKLGIAKESRNDLLASLRHAERRLADLEGRVGR
jgi:uncharacterized coiled-coil protein SlyX